MTAMPPPTMAPPSQRAPGTIVDSAVASPTPVRAIAAISEAIVKGTS